MIKAGTPLVAPRKGEVPDYRAVSERFQKLIGGNGSVNLPLSFGKGILYEGGVRVPLIVQWPGVVGAGKVSEAVVSHLDILPTCVAAAGGKLPADREYDGADLRGYFAGKAGLDRSADVLAGVARPGGADGKVEARLDRRCLAAAYDLAADVEEEKVSRQYTRRLSATCRRRGRPGIRRTSPPCSNSR